MKLFHLAAFLASLAALVALPVPAGPAASLLFAAALLEIARQDYSTRRPLRLPASPRRRPRTRFRAPALVLAGESHRLAA